MKKKGFTLLEIIIVIIIVGVLSSLALPRLFAVVEGSRAAEAVMGIMTIRNAVERCYMMNNGSYAPCDLSSVENTLGIDDPGNSPNAHFGYYFDARTGPNGEYYFIVARRVQNDGGDQYVNCPIVMGYKIVPEVYDVCQARFSAYSNEKKFYWAAADIYKSAVPR